MLERLESVLLDDPWRHAALVFTSGQSGIAMMITGLSFRVDSFSTRDRKSLALEAKTFSLWSVET